MIFLLDTTLFCITQALLNSELKLSYGLLTTAFILHWNWNDTICIQDYLLPCYLSSGNKASKLLGMDRLEGCGKDASKGMVHPQTSGSHHSRILLMGKCLALSYGVWVNVASMWGSTRVTGFSSAPSIILFSFTCAKGHKEGMCRWVILGHWWPMSLLCLSSLTLSLWEKGEQEQLSSAVGLRMMRSERKQPRDVERTATLSLFLPSH